MHNRSTIYYTDPYKYLRNLAGIDYELPENDAIASKHCRGSVIRNGIIIYWSIVHLLVQYTNNKNARYKC